MHECMSDVTDSSPGVLVLNPAFLVFYCGHFFRSQSFDPGEGPGGDSEEGELAGAEVPRQQGRGRPRGHGSFLVSQLKVNFFIGRSDEGCHNLLKGPGKFHFHAPIRALLINNKHIGLLTQGTPSYTVFNYYYDRYVITL